MSAKTIFIILITIFATVVLMNNNNEMSFWLFGETKISKLAVLGGMFFTGWMIGFLMGRPKSRTPQNDDVQESENYRSEPESGLSDEDRDYIR